MFNKKINTIEDVFKSETKDRALILNIIICIVAFLIFYFAPSIFYAITYAITKHQMLSETLGRIIAIVLIALLFYKDLIKEVKELKNKIGSKIGTSFKYYGIGLGIMMFSNLILLILFKDISTNETQVRELLLSNPIPMMFTISILAPLIEELAFRKSLSPLFKSKWIFALVSGALFGLGHLMVDFTSGSFQIYKLLYLIPYGSLGFSFALMNRDNNTTFSSILIHCMHNFLTGLLILSQGGL